MQKFSIYILRCAQKELSNLPKNIYENIRDTIRKLADEPRPYGCLKLSNRNGWRIKIGDYRVIYEIDDKQRIITILHIGHRRDIYQ